MGSHATASLAGTAASSALLLGLSGTVLVATMDRWSQEASQLAESTASEALLQLAPPTIRIVSATGDADQGRLLAVTLLVRARSGDTADLAALRIEGQAAFGRAWLTDGVPEILAVRDADASLADGLLGDADLAEIQLGLAGLPSIGGGDEFVLALHTPGARPLRIALEVPVGPTGATELSVVERP